MINPRSQSWTDYWQIIGRRRWLLALPVVICWLAVWGVCWFLPAVYRSEATILIEQQKVPEHYVVANVTADLQERLQSMTQQVLSRTRLRRIIDDLHLYADDRHRLSPDELVERMRKDIKIEVVETPGRPDELTAFKIYYSGPEPKLTQQVTTDLATFFIDENIRAREKQSEETTTFLDNQLQEARQHLEAQELKIKEFKGQYLGQLPGQLQSNLQILSGVQGRLQDANERLERAEQQKVYLTSLLSQYQALAQEIHEGDKGTDLSPPALDDELDKQKRQLAALEAQYTDEHPDVVKMKGEIARTEQLKAQIESDLSKPADGSVATAAANNELLSSDKKTISPTVEIRSQIKSNELEIQNRKKEIKELETSVDEYKVKLNQTPVREQQLADLTRDYDQSRTNYESLLAKSNQSELATNLEKRQQGEGFRILDPPSLPQKPYWPNRLQLTFFGLIAGAAFGIVGAFLAESVDDRVYHESDLATVAGLPVLGTVPPMPTWMEQRHKVWMTSFEWASGLAMAAILVAGTLFAYYRG
ncbi:MAG TPA: XrtA system polysaccharide chain length determinant [Terriglobales bacterium]